MSGAQSTAGGQLTPQGVDLDDIIKIAVPIVISLLQNAPQVRAQASQPLNPQSLFSGVVKTPFGGGGVSLFNNLPQLKPQSLFSGAINTPFGGGGITLFDNQAQVSPQGIDWGGALAQVGQAVSQQVLNNLPTIISGVISLLAASPVLKPQSAGPVRPQDFDLGGFLGSAAGAIGQAAANAAAQAVQTAILSALASHAQPSQNH